MTRITFSFYELNTLKKRNVYVTPGTSILDAALKISINITHTCGGCCVCASCHCIIENGFSSLSRIGKNELSTLNKVLGVKYNSRLSCQALVNDKNVLVYIPKQNMNL